MIWNHPYVSYSIDSAGDMEQPYVSYNINSAGDIEHSHVI